MTLSLATRQFVGDPAVSERIRSLILEIADSLVSRLELAPEAIILAGSFARGEGSVLVRGPCVKVLGDFEFMVVFPPGADRRRLQHALDLEARALSQEFHARQIACELEFRAVTLKYFETLRPHIFGYELLSHALPVWGKAESLLSARRFSASAIPLWDAWRMLNNRLLEQLQWVETFESADREALVEVSYQLLKFHLDLGTSLLLFAGRYQDTYAGRAAALRSWISDRGGQDKPPFLKEIAGRVRNCTAFKLSPNKAVGFLGVHLDDNTEKLRENIRHFVFGLVPLVHAVWAWEAAQLTGISSDKQFTDEFLHETAMRCQPRREKLRGWIKLILMPEVRMQPGFARRALSLFLRGSPRYLVYRVATELFFRLPNVLLRGQPDVELAGLESYLPVRFARHSHETRTWWRLRSDVLTGWRLFLRNHWA